MKPKKYGYPSKLLDWAYENSPGESQKRRRMQDLYGENRPIPSAYDRALAAKCTNGTFVGKEKDGVKAYKGIPYALPPVKALRWQPPVDAPDDNGVYEALYFGKSPIQTEWPSEEGSYYPKGEDCLTLNIWTAGGTGNAVMVFFHGGSYGWGGTSDPIYDGQNFVAAHPDVVLVTVEYRLGILGFIDFSQVPGGEDYQFSGNLGLLDHVCALRWIRKNIAAFGGDPDNVTIFGESAGGGTVSLLPLMPEAKGLFKRVIAESGSIALTSHRKQCYKLTQMLLKKTGAKNMEELAALEEAELIRVNKELNDYNNFPERDGVVLPENLYEAYEQGLSSHVDMMIGTNADETRYWIREMGYYYKRWLGPIIFRLCMPLMFRSNMERVSPKDQELVEEYMELIPYRKLWKIVEFYNDILFYVPAAFQAQKHTENGGKAFVYYWYYPSAHKNLGACHAVELSSVFNNLDVTIYTEKNTSRTLADRVQNLWVSFAKTGDPSTEDIIWKPYTLPERTTLYLGSRIRCEDYPLEQRRGHIAPLLKYTLNGCYTNLRIKIPFFHTLAAVILGLLGLIPAVCYILWDLVLRGVKRLIRRRTDLNR